MKFSIWRSSWKVLVLVSFASASSIVLRAEVQPQEPLQVTMAHFAESLGVRCAFCHGDQENLGGKDPETAAAAQGKRKIARRMMEMVREINGKYMGELSPMPTNAIKWARVNCFTCHRGSTYPER